MIHADRIHRLNDKPTRAEGGFVLYWMQQSQRSDWNHALEYAIIRANDLELPLAVVFGLTDDYPSANLRHYSFMLEGLEETFNSLEKRGALALCGRGHPPEIAIAASRDAALTICDQGYLRHQAEWRMQLAESSECEVVEIESDIIVPVETATDHAEYMARTLRPRINRQLGDFLVPVSAAKLSKPWKKYGGKFQALDNFEKKFPSIGTLKLDTSVAPSRILKGGPSAARQRLGEFISTSLEVYPQNSNQPQTDHISMLSPYLHFGQISPLFIALEVSNSRCSEESKAAFLEQVIVRRELAINFTWYGPNYDRIECLPDWALDTLDRHRRDKREYVYDLDQLELSKTHDPYWNAAMDEMRHTGFMHNYMRMYWGKKILEWTESPETAFETALHLNNKYFIDGRDPNSYAGVAWVFGKHDQAWKERPVFGKTRYMNAAGLRRKCDIEAYIKKVDRLKRS